jgi:hypothetical protein
MELVSEAPDCKRKLIRQESTKDDTSSFVFEKLLI